MRCRSYKLTFLDGDLAGKSVTLADEKEVVIGRSKSNCRVVVEDRLVSRQHVRLEMTDAGVTASNIGSAHGTLLNGNRIQKTVLLSADDLLQIGDTHLRFTPLSEPKASGDGQTAMGVSAGAPAPLHEINAPDAVPEEGDGETRYVPPAEPEDGDEDDGPDETRVIADGETRILEARELGGRPGAGKAITSQKPMFGFALIAVCLVAGSLYFMSQHALSGKGGGGTGALPVSYHDAQFEFAFSYPATWVRAPGQNGALVSFQLLNHSKTAIASADIFADRKSEYQLTGLTSGFNSYLDVLSSRHKRFRLCGRDAMTLNDAKVIFFAYDSEAAIGKGIYLLSGNSRVVAECSCDASSWPQLKDTFTEILSSFRLDNVQSVIDYPEPDENMRRLALSDPAKLKDNALVCFNVGKSLLEHRNVRPDNPYRAIGQFETCLQMTEAVSQKPDFRNEAAQKLISARKTFEQAVSDQRFAITLAEKQSDLHEAYWEACKLMQMIPDKTHPVYQDAYKLTQKYQESK